MENLPESEKKEAEEKREEKTKFWLLIKFFVMLLVAISTPLICNAIHFEESKFIMIIFFGFFAKEVWKEEGKPEEELAFFWIFC